MPEPYKRQPYPLSNLNDGARFVKVTCAYCKRTHHYFPTDLMQIFGDVDVDSLADRMRCIAGDHGTLRVEAISPTGREGVGMRVRRLVGFKIKRIPVWKEE